MLMPRNDDHVAVGHTPGAEMFRWIEVGRIRLDEDKDGAVVAIRAPGSDGPTWLSAAELAGLTRHLAGWFMDDPAETIKQIEVAVSRVKDELDAWDDRARIDEEHPPYAKLVQTLDAVIAACKELRDKGPFAASSEAAR